MAYIDYYEYLNLGGVYDEATFLRNIDRTCAIIDNATSSRLQNMAEIPHTVKALCRDLVDYYATNWKFNEKEVVSYSESAGSLSESITYASRNIEKLKRETDDMIEEYLGSVTNDNGVPLLYRGAAS